MLTIGSGFVAAAAVLALVGLGLSRAGQADAAEKVTYDPHSRELNYTLPTFAGGTIQSTTLRGRPAVINFYASWCEVCNAEMPAFQRVHASAGDAVAFVGVNPQTNDSDRRQAEMVTQTGVRYPTARDRNDKLLRTFNTTGALPTTLFIDAHGRVARVHNGGYDEPGLRAAIQEYLGVTV